MRKLLLWGATGKRQRSRKSYEITRDSFVRVYPSIDDSGDRGGLQVIASLMKRLMKGSSSLR